MDFTSYLEKVHNFILMQWSRFYNQFNRRLPLGIPYENIFPIKLKDLEQILVLLKYRPIFTVSSLYLYFPHFRRQTPAEDETGPQLAAHKLSA